MALFRGVEFVPPGKEFRQLVDPFSAYYARQEPLRVTATVTYADRREQQFRTPCRTTWRSTGISATWPDSSHFRPAKEELSYGHRDTQ